MIAHEGDTNTLPDWLLKRHGFKKMRKRKDSYTHSLRINDRHAILYDCSGFITWMRRVSPKGRIIALLLVPEPVRDWSHLGRIVGRIKAKIVKIEE